MLIFKKTYIDILYIQQNPSFLNLPHEVLVEYVDVDPPLKSCLHHEEFPVDMNFEVWPTTLGRTHLIDWFGSLLHVPCKRGTHNRYVIYN